MLLAAKSRVVSVVLERPGQADSEEVQPHVEAGVERSESPAPAGDGRLGVADGLQLPGDPTRAQCRLIAVEDVVAPAGGDRLEGGLGGEHARLDGGMAALDPGHVEEAGGAADQ